MKLASMGAFDAKNHFSELLEKALHGKETVVTKHGRPIAKIVPFREDDHPSKEVFDRIAKTRDKIAQRGGILNKGESWKDLAREGLR